MPPPWPELASVIKARLARASLPRGTWLLLRVLEPFLSSPPPRPVPSFTLLLLEPSPDCWSPEALAATPVSSVPAQAAEGRGLGGKIFLTTSQLRLDKIAGQHLPSESHSSFFLLLCFCLQDSPDLVFLTLLLIFFLILAMLFLISRYSFVFPASSPFPAPCFSFRSPLHPWRCSWVFTIPPTGQSPIFFLPGYPGLLPSGATFSECHPVLCPWQDVLCHLSGLNKGWCVYLWRWAG